MLIGNKFWAVPILLGILLAVLYPYPAFEVNIVIYFFLSLIMFLTSLVYDSSRFRLKSEDHPYVLLFLFFGMVFFPALLWLLAKLTLSDAVLLQGFFYASLSPLAIVAPHFVKLHNGNDQASFQVMWFSHFLALPLLFIMTSIFLPRNVDISFSSYFRDLLFVAIAPILLAQILKKYVLKKDFNHLSIAKVVPLLNFFCIGLITYTLFGTMQVKVGFSAIQTSDLIILFVLALLQDFAPLFLGRKLFKNQNDLKDSLAISISIKNVALTSGLLLFYSPKMAFAAALCLPAHAVYFLYLSYFKLEKSKI